jgi:electron transfer flavoprotein beta subunit
MPQANRSWENASMKIVVCCKAVPGIVTELQIGPDRKTLQYQGQLLSMNECDEYALEEALALKRAHGGNITVITMGSIKTQDILYLALAKGADRAVRVDFEGNDPRVASTVLAAALKKIEFDLVLTGTQSRDTLGGQVGIAAASVLGLPFAYSVVDVAVGADPIVKVRKEIGGGRYMEVELPLPALLCVQTGIQALSYVPPARRMRARQQPISSFGLDDLGLKAEGLVPRSYHFVSVGPPERTHQVHLFEGTPQEIAASLLAKIQEAR